MKKRGHWIVEDGDTLRAVTTHKPTRGAMERAGLTACAVRFAPPPLQKSFSFEADTFSLYSEKAPPTTTTTTGADFHKRAHLRDLFEGKDLAALASEPQQGRR